MEGHLKNAHEAESIVLTFALARNTLNTDFSFPNHLVTFGQEASYEQNRILSVLGLQGLEVSAVCFWMERVHVSPPWKNQEASEASLLCLPKHGLFQRFAIKNRKKKVE